MILTAITFLHSFVSCDDYFSQLFSGLKLGVKKSVDLCAEEIAAEIKKQLGHSARKDFVLTCCPSPIPNYSALYISTAVAKKLGIPLISLKRRVLGQEKYYDYYYSKDKKERLKLIKETLICPKGKFNGRNIILIDDAYSTGAAMESAEKILRKNGAKIIIQIAYLKLPKKCSATEAEVAQCLFTKYGLDFLVSTASDENNFLTPRFLYTLLQLQPSQLKTILDSVSVSRKSYLIRSIKEYEKAQCEK